MPKGNKALREVIKGDLLIQLNELWRKAESYHDGQKGDNIQGTKHCIAVEKNLEKLIPDDKKEKELKPIDLFVLSAAACLLDIGKVVADDARGWKSDHGKQSMEIILEEYDKLGLDKGQAIAVGYVVSVHGDGKLDELPRNPTVIGNEEINIIELAAIFRLADMLDTNYQRAPELLSAIKFPDGNVPSKWRGRQAITGWYLDEQDRIILQASPKPEEIDAVYTLKSMMDEDLAKISPYLKLYKYPSELGNLDVGDVFIKPDLKKKAISQRPFPSKDFDTKEGRNIFKGTGKGFEELLARIKGDPQEEKHKQKRTFSKTNEKYREESGEKGKGSFNYLRSFSIVLAKTFPKVYQGITYIKDKKKIDMLLQNLSEVNFDGHLWWHNGEGNMSTQFKRLNDEVWLMGADKMFIEIKVKSAWVHSNPDIIYNECILINAESMPSFGVYGEESTGEEVGLVDDRHYITIEEFNNGFAEINGEIVDLKKHDVERRIREMNPMSYFIATSFHCVLQIKNDETVRDLIKKIQPAHNISEDEIRQFLNEIRRNSHPDIDARL